MLFQCIVANPPFSLDKWDSGFLSNAVLDAKGKKPEKMNASLDPWGRFDWGVPPSSRVIMLLFCICSTALTTVMAEWLSCCPTVYCSAVRAKAKFAGRFVEHNLLDAVIGLPANLFYGTGIPALHSGVPQGSH